MTGEAEKPQVVGTEGEDDDHDNDHEDEKKHEEDGESSEDERLVVDEELLREREANLTDEQKQVCASSHECCKIVLMSMGNMSVEIKLEAASNN